MKPVAPEPLPPLGRGVGGLAAVAADDMIGAHPEPPFDADRRAGQRVRLETGPPAPTGNARTADHTALAPARAALADLYPRDETMGVALRAALVSWLAGDTVLSTNNAITEEAPVRASLPWASIAASASADATTPRPKPGAGARHPLNCVPGRPPRQCHNAGRGNRGGIPPLPRDQSAFRIVTQFSAFARRTARRQPTFDPARIPFSPDRQLINQSENRREVPNPAPPSCSRFQRATPGVPP